MRSIALVSLLFIAGLAGCSPPAERDAPALSVTVPGGTVAWTFASDPTPSLTLSRDSGAGQSRPVLILTCLDRNQAGVEARVSSAQSGPITLRLTAGETTFAVPARRGQADGQWTLFGVGDAPSGWAEALGAAETLTLDYGDQGFEVGGPGEDLTQAFGERCSAPGEARG